MNAVAQIRTITAPIGSKITPDFLVNFFHNLLGAGVAPKIETIKITE